MKPEPTPDPDGEYLKCDQCGRIAYYDDPGSCTCSRWSDRMEWATEDEIKQHLESKDHE